MKKGQEEIVGFLLIVLIVIILGVVFLFMFKGNSSQEESPKIENLLNALIGTTVDGKSIGGRIENCERGEGCEFLAQGLTNLTDTVFDKMGYSLGRNMKGFNLTISEGMEYSYSGGIVTSRSVADAIVVKNSLVKLKFYY